ncbi:MAG: alpha-1,4-glucan--maltose-1-phosphate maltosyltransferase [Chloroflexi bacterium]|nr:alpha-1,4-glucan--maltose-1-phosphate maltosyltransferase [Chloroflexota bacterium]
MRRPASCGQPSEPAPPQPASTSSALPSSTDDGCADTLPAAYRTVVIERVTPSVDDGRYAVKRETGDSLIVEADIFKEGHDLFAARVAYRLPHDDAWQYTPMRFVDNDRWRGEIALTEPGRWTYTVEAYPDLYRSWVADTRKKAEAGQDVTGDLLEGARLVAQAAERAPRGERNTLADASKTIEARASTPDGLQLALDPVLTDLVAGYFDPDLVTRYDRDFEVMVDRVRARFGAWYEIFPRSQGTDPTRSATFREAEQRVPDIAAMGFDVLYLTPIHPIGHTNRKGPNNALTAGPDDPGSPYAIGSAAGGHTAVEPSLGTLADFDHFERVVRDHGMEIALDFAIQVSPDHPWVTEHPEWFYHRPDGSIKFAENPPKKYEDIYPINFHTEDWRALWTALKDVVLFWVGHGVKIYRVDNPHTKPLDFWEWMIREVQCDHPDVIFLSEAFTRPKVMRALAKAGFTQSYTYFTWRNYKDEIAEYLTEITHPPVAEYFRGNLFVNTPDILPEILQQGGRPAFIMRLVLAATAGSTYGIYNGFELCENVSRGPGSEYYLDSEMYQFKVWDWDRPGNIVDVVSRVNRIRRDNPALHEYSNLRFYFSEDPNILFYGKATPEGDNVIFVVLNVDPFAPHYGTIVLPPGEHGIRDDETYEVEDLLTGARYTWYGRHNWVRLDPGVWPAHILRVHRAV